MILIVLIKKFQVREKLFIYSWNSQDSHTFISLIYLFTCFVWRFGQAQRYIHS